MGVAASSDARDRLMLGWSECRLGGGTADVQPSCGDLLSSQTLVCSFASAAVVDSVIGAELVIDVQFASTGVPAYWEFGDSGCDRAGLLLGFPAPGACADPWDGFGNAALVSVQPGVPGGVASRQRMVLVATVPAVQARTLDADVVYDAMSLEFLHNGVCLGCQTPACVVLESVKLFRLPGAAEVTLTADPDLTENFATWQTGLGADCQSVPAGRPSWGQLKVRYR